MNKSVISITAAAFLFITLIPGCDDNSNKNILENNINIEKTVKNDVYLEDENVGGLKESDIMQKLGNFAAKLDIAPQDAALDETTWELSKKEKSGKKVNIQKTLESLINSSEGTKLKLVVEDVAPQATAETLVKNIVLISSYSTPILDKQDARVNNIDIASDKLSYKKIAPGEEFSFNRTVGRRTEAKGYEEAPIIIKTEDGYKKGYGVGGGICQLASTLYNAVEKVGMEVTERHTHSKDVHYVPDGRDATVSYGSVDFKFVNTRQYPVMIKVYKTKNNLTVKLFENRN